MTSPGHVAQVVTGKRMNMRLRVFLCYVRSILCRFLIVARVSVWQSLMCSVVHVFLIVKSGSVRMEG